MTIKSRPRGFTMMSMLFILVALTALGAALASLSTRQHMGSASELETARANQAAFAGLEWGSYGTLTPASAPACFANTNLSAAGMTVTVRCTRTTANDGSETYNFYQLVANACNQPSGGACPATGTPQPTYVEQQLTRTVQRGP